MRGKANRKHETIKAALSLILSVCMILGLLPVQQLIPEQAREAAGIADTAQAGSVTLNDPRIVEDSSMEAGQKVTWDCIWFGSYPQSEVTSDELIEYFRHVTTGWDENGDIRIGGEKYRRIRKGNATGVYSDVNHYKWDNNYHYFRFEPIKWHVLSVDGDTALLLSDQILDAQRPYYDSSYGFGMYRWLNESFINTSFEEVEQNAIQKDNRKGQVFLLSESDICNEEYGFAKGRQTHDEARSWIRGSDYARAMGLIGLTNGWWWLSGNQGNTGYHVHEYGEVDANAGISGYYEGGVRPALQLNLSSDIFSSGICSYAGTVSSDGTTNEVGKNTAPTEYPDGDGVLSGKLGNPWFVENSNMVSGQKVTWDCVWFGSYPQSEVTSEELVEYFRSVATGWDKNGDIRIGGEKYRRIKKENTTKVYSDANHYKWDNNYHYFRFEPIKWHVLSVDGDTALLLSDQILDAQRPYYDSSYGFGMYRWLNESFINTSFEEVEQNAIQKDNRKGQVFLLSESDICNEEYGFAKGRQTHDEARSWIRGSDYARAMGLIGLTNGWWWLSGNQGNTGYHVHEYGEVDANAGISGYYEGGVRPALQLNMSSDIFSSGICSYAGTVSSDGTNNEVGKETASGDDGSGGDIAKPCSLSFSKVISKKINDTIVVSANLVFSDEGETSENLIMDCINNRISWELSDDTIAEIKSFSSVVSDNYREATINIQIEPKKKGDVVLCGRIEDAVSGSITEKSIIKIYDNDYVAELDGWPIGNGASVFGYREGYKIPWEQYRTLFGSSITSAWENLFYGGGKSLLCKWDGSCFGLCLLSAANYDGKIELKDYFPNNTSKKYLTEYGYSGITKFSDTISDPVYCGKEMYDVKDNPDIINVIERAFLSQYSKEFAETEIGKCDSDYSELLNAVENRGDRIIVNMEGFQWGHTVLIDDYQGTTEDGWYCFSLYDCNFPSGGSDLSNPLFIYDDSSELLLNPNTGEWRYLVRSNNKWDIEQNGAYRILGHSYIRFYDVSNLSPSYFTNSLTTNLFSNSVFNGKNIEINDGEKTIVKFENDSLVDMSNGYDYSVIYGGYNSGNLKYMDIGDDFTIKSDSLELFTVGKDNKTSYCVSSDKESQVKMDVKEGKLSVHADEDAQVRIEIGELDNDSSELIGLSFDLPNNEEINVNYNEGYVSVDSTKDVEAEVYSVDKNGNDESKMCVVKENTTIEFPSEINNPEKTLSAPEVVSDSGMTAGQKVTWDCIWFGSYPQAEVIPSGNYTAIGSEYLQEGDTIVDDGLYATLQSANGWDSKGDITLNGLKYRRMKMDDATYGTSGEYYQYNWSDSTTYHYFKYEPIKWRVLDVDGDRALILADKGLDDRQYNTVKENVTWEKSTIRSFLNGYGASANQRGIDFSSSQNFLTTAFGSSQQAALFDSNVIQSDSLYNTSADARGNDTVDKVFLLSDSQVYGTDKAKSYGFVSSRDTYDEARRCKSSTYAKAMGAWWNGGSSYRGNCRWWLRSPGYDSDGAKSVGSHGIVEGYSVNYNDLAARPVSFLNLKYTNLYSFAGTVCSDGTVSEEEEEHTHSYGTTWKSDADSHWKECTCGEKTEEASHEFEWVTDKTATVEETGLKHEECRVCGYKRSENTIIEKTPREHTHSYGSTWKSDADSHWKECTCGEKSEEAPHGFEWVTDKTATVEETGLKHEECRVCGYKRSENTIIEKTPREHTHSYGSTWKSDADSHWKECTCGEKSEEAPHGFEWVTDKTATVEETGLKHEECRVCGYKRSENTVIEKIAKQEEEKPTETKKGVISISLSAKDKKLIIGSSFTLTANVLPLDATDRSVTFKSSNEKIVLVSQKGVVTARANGTAVITVTSRSNPSIHASCKVTVPKPSVKISGKSKVKRGKSVTLTAKVTNFNGTVKWSLDKKSKKLATLSKSSGKKTSLKAKKKAKKKAVITVTVTAGNVKKSKKIKIY